MTPEFFLQITFNSLVIGLAYVLMGAGLTIVFSIMHIVNMAHGDLYMLGAFGAYILAVEAGLNYILAFVIAVAVSGGVGIIMERYFFRPFGNQLMAPFVVGAGMILIIEATMMRVFGGTERGVPKVFPGTTRLAGVTMPNDRIVVICAALAIMAALHLFLTYTKSGQAMRACAQDGDAAALQGISVGRTRSLCMFVGSTLAAVAGALLGPIFYVSPFIGQPIVMKAFVIIVIGGMGSIPGAALGGLMLGFIESFGTTLIDAPIAALISFSLMIVVMLVRPRGLLGHA